MSDKIELMMLCTVLQNNFSCLSQSESRTQPCHVRIYIVFYSLMTLKSKQQILHCILQIIHNYAKYLKSHYTVTTTCPLSPLFFPPMR